MSGIAYHYERTVQSVPSSIDIGVGLSGEPSAVMTLFWIYDMLYYIAFGVLAMRRRHMQPLKARNIFLVMISSLCGFAIRCWTIIAGVLENSRARCDVDRWVTNLAYPGLVLPYLIQSLRLFFIFQQSSFVSHQRVDEYESQHHTSRRDGSTSPSDVLMDRSRRNTPSLIDDTARKATTDGQVYQALDDDDDQHDHRNSEHARSLDISPDSALAYVPTSLSSPPAISGRTGAVTSPAYSSSVDVFGSLDDHQRAMVQPSYSPPTFQPRSMSGSEATRAQMSHSLFIVPDDDGDGTGDSHESNAQSGHPMSTSANPHGSHVGSAAGRYHHVHRSHMNSKYSVHSYTDIRMLKWLLLLLLPFVLFGCIEQFYGLEYTPTILDCSEYYTTSQVSLAVFHFVEAFVLMAALFFVWNVWDEFSIRRELIVVLCADIVIGLVQIISLATDKNPADPVSSAMLSTARVQCFFFVSVALPVFSTYCDPVGYRVTDVRADTLDLNSLEAVLKNVEAYEYFSRFMFADNAVSLLLFYVESELFRELDDPVEMYEEAVRISRQYLYREIFEQSEQVFSEEAVDVVSCVSSHAINSVISSLNASASSRRLESTDIFNDVHRQVVERMRLFYFPAFQRSQLFTRLHRSASRGSFVHRSLAASEMT
jgi:Regulator of G protein signaling domain